MAGLETSAVFQVGGTEALSPGGGGIMAGLETSAVFQVGGTEALSPGGGGTSWPDWRRQPSSR